MAHGKNYRAAAEKIEAEKLYEPKEAVALLKQVAFAKFDETVELHLRTGLDTRHADQQLRGTLTLPHGLGKSQRILVFAEGEAARIAEQAGADEVGGDRTDQEGRRRLPGLRRGAGDEGDDGQGRPAGPRPRAPRA